MAHPKRPTKTIWKQTNPQADEYSEKLTNKFLADVERYPYLKRIPVLDNETMLKLGIITPKEYQPVYEEIPIFSNLTDKQLEALLPLFNDYCAKKPFGVEELKDIFNLKADGLQIKNAKLLAYIFNQLSSHNLIVDNWQDIFREKKTFISRNGKPINLSSELSNFITDITGDGLDAKGKLKPTHNRNKRIAQRINEVIDTLCS